MVKTLNLGKKQKMYPEHNAIIGDVRVKLHNGKLIVDVVHLKMA